MAQGINHFWAVCWDLISYFHVWLRWLLFCATVRACLRRPLAPAGPRTIIAHSSASATLSTGRHFSIGLAGWNVEMCLRQPKDMQLGREPQLQTEGSTSWHSCQIKMTGQIGVCLCVRVHEESLLQVTEQGVSWYPRSLVSIFVIISASWFSLHPWNCFIHNLSH